ncbi:clavesin-2-like [Cimex lectularius]|uniref:CRAL-TRIO domain-containing protein n=1 Tax=Cimex lectularius TaxID=79782 RepID=A0A8I6RE68_CIMLE|nr:clavesin-2-like [Cimex lectularius]
MEAYWKVSLEEEFKRNKELKQDDLTLIKDWMSKTPHLPKLIDVQIVLFLRACNFSLERTKEVIDLNYTMRTRLPEMFADRDLKRDWLQKAMANMNVTFMPNRDKHGNVVVLYQIKKMDISNFNMEEYAKLTFMLQDMSNCMLGSAPGYVFIQDLQNLTFSEILQCPISSTSNMLKFTQEASNCVIKGLHFINGGMVIEKLFALMNPFLKPDVKKLIFVHSTVDSMVEAVGKEVVPSDYGGTGPSWKELNEKTIQDLNEHQQYFFEEMKQRVVEKKRTANELKEYGIQGSFKKLELD